MKHYENWIGFIVSSSNSHVVNTNFKCLYIDSDSGKNTWNLFNSKLCIDQIHFKHCAFFCISGWGQQTGKHQGTVTVYEGSKIIPSLRKKTECLEYNSKY